MAYMMCQIRMLEGLYGCLQRVPPSYVIVQRMWDEAGEKIKMRVPGLEGTQIVSSVEVFGVFVSRLVVSFGIKDSPQPISVELAVPPSFVRTPSAE